MRTPAHIRRRILLISTALVAAAATGVGLAEARMPFAPKTLTAADYSRAERFMGGGVNGLVLNSSVRPTWLPDGRFWYVRNSTDGSSQAVLVNPAAKTRVVCTPTTAECQGIDGLDLNAVGSGRGGRAGSPAGPLGRTRRRTRRQRPGAIGGFAPRHARGLHPRLEPARAICRELKSTRSRPTAWSIGYASNTRQELPYCSDWPSFLDDFQRHWPTDEDIYVDFVRDGAAAMARPARVTHTGGD